VSYLAYSGSIILPDYWTQTAAALTITAFGILYWGFRPQINRFFKEKRDFRGSKIETAPTTIEEIQKSTPPLDITKLPIDNSLLNDIYKEARSKAIDIYQDAQLSSFSIIAFPFSRMVSRYTVFLTFYSKWANKTCEFILFENSQEVEHSPPDKRAKFGYERGVFTTLPWIENPQWKQFIEKAYRKIEPLTPVKSSRYNLQARPPPNMYWYLNFEDGFSGAEYPFHWNGKKIDENSVKRLD